MYGGLGIEEINGRNRTFVEGLREGLNEVEGMAVGWVLGGLGDGVGRDESWEEAVGRAEGLEKLRKRVERAGGRWVPEEITGVRDLKKFFTVSLTFLSPIFFLKGKLIL